MPWFKVDDALALHMKAILAGNQALGLWVRAGSWSMHQLTDGHVPKAIVTALGGSKGDAESLITAGLWETAEGGYQFHDWSEYQPTREAVLADREAAAERMRRVRANKGANVPPNEQGTFGVGSSSPSRPVPSRPTDSSKTSTSQSSNKHANETTDAEEISEMTRRLAGQAGINNLTSLINATATHTNREITADGAYQLAVHIIDKAKSYPKNPQMYVTRAISMSPFEVQQFIDERGLAS